MKYLNADLSKFTIYVYFNKNAKANKAAVASAEIVFKNSNGVETSVTGSERRYWSHELKTALGIGGFPIELTLNSNITKPIPAVYFDATAASADKSHGAWANLFKEEIKIYVTPTDYFKTKFREILTDTVISHRSGKESKKWLASPNMSYWPQQLNFAFWCATTGCGISHKTLDIVPEQVKSFLLFHIYFTMRRILFELGGMQSEAAVPGDPTFSQINQNYDIPSYRRICAEFGIHADSDSQGNFRFKRGINHGLGECLYLHFLSGSIIY